MKMSTLSRPTFYSVTYIFMILASALLVNTAFTKVITERQLDFIPDEETLLEGHIQIAVDSRSSLSFKDDYPLLKELDTSEILSLGGNQKYFAAKYAFMAPKPLSFFQREQFLNEKGYLLFSKKSSISQVERIAPHSLRLKISKNLAMYTIDGTGDFDLFNLDEFHQLPFSAKISELAHPFTPELMMMQKMYDFDKILTKAAHLCFFTPVNDQKTMLVCYGLSAMDKGWYNRTRWLIDAEKKYRDEMLHFIQNITN